MLVSCHYGSWPAYSSLPSPMACSGWRSCIHSHACMLPTSGGTMTSCSSLPSPVACSGWRSCFHSYPACGLSSVEQWVPVAACLFDEAEVRSPQLHTEAGEQASAEHRFCTGLVSRPDFYVRILLPVQGLHQVMHLCWLLHIAFLN